MAAYNSNDRSPSTTWGYRRVKMPSSAPQASSASRRGRHPATLSKRNPREPLTITVTYRGGPECWWEIKARGVTFRRPGYVALHDLLSEVNRMMDN